MSPCTCTWDFGLYPGLEDLGKLHVSPSLNLSQLCGDIHLTRKSPILFSLPFAITVEEATQQREPQGFQGPRGLSFAPKLCSQYRHTLLDLSPASHTHTHVAVGKLTSLSLKILCCFSVSSTILCLSAYPSSVGLHCYHLCDSGRFPMGLLRMCISWGFFPTIEQPGPGSRKE